MNSLLINLMLELSVFVLKHVWLHFILALYQFVGYVGWQSSLMVQSSLQRDLKQIIVCGPLPWAFDVPMNNTSAWITAAHNKLTVFKLAWHLLRTQTNPIPLV